MRRILAFAALAVLALAPRSPLAEGAATAAGQLVCQAPYIIDGDTLDCAGTRVRLQGIDAPEMPGHCRHGRRCTPGDPFAAKAALQAMTRGPVVCIPERVDSYGRSIAQCWAGETNLSCAMIAGGWAVPRYAALECPLK